MNDFYDRMASPYHLIFPNGEESIERQAGQLAGVIHDRWGAGAQTVLDVSCGIGTQALSLARRGFAVTASDLSAGAVARARDDPQLLAGYVLHELLEPERPADALAYLALTASDLWPGRGWNLLVEPVPYLTRLKTFCEQNGFDAESRWHERAVAALAA